LNASNAVTFERWDETPSTRIELQNINESWSSFKHS